MSGERDGTETEALSNEVVRLMGNELKRLRDEYAAVEERNKVLMEENTRLKHKLDTKRRALQAKAGSTGQGDLKEEEPSILLSGNHYDQVKRALDESVQQREAERVDHERVVEELRNRLVRAKEKRTALRAALSETREVNPKQLLRCDELNSLDPSNLRGFTVASGGVWGSLGKALNEPRYHEAIWKCCYDDSLWMASQDFSIFFAPSHHYDKGTGSFKHSQQDALCLGDTRGVFHQESGQKWLYCGDFKCEWACSIPFLDLESFTRATAGTITRLKQRITDRTCAGGGPTSRTVASKMLEDGLMMVTCYGLTKIGYNHQVDLAMEAYVHKRGQAKGKKRQLDDTSPGSGKNKKKRKQ